MKMKKIKLTIAEILNSVNELKYLSKKEIRNIKFNYSIGRTYHSLEKISKTVLPLREATAKKHNVLIQVINNKEALTSDNVENIENYKKEWAEFLNTKEKVEYYGTLKLSDFEKALKEDKELKLNSFWAKNLGWLIEDK